MNFLNSTIRPQAFATTAIAVAILSACGGGNSSSSSADSSAARSSALSVGAPAPDSASVNGDVSFEAQKFAQAALRGQQIIDATTKEAGGTTRVPPAPTVPVPVVTAPAVPAPAVPAPVVPAPAVPAPVVPAPVVTTPVVTTPAAPAPALPAPTPPAPAVPAPTVPALPAPEAPPTVQVIYVSPQGNDAWSGALGTANADRTDGPVKSLPVAQTRARAKLSAMASGATRLPVRVKIAAGTYNLDTPLLFTPADSGTASALVYYEAIVPGTVLISGGVPLARSAGSAAPGRVRFDAPAAAGTSYAGGSQLFVNGRRAVLARQPNVGQYWFARSAVAVPGEPANDAGHEAFTTSADATNWINALNATDRQRAVVQVMQSWNDEQHRFSSQAAPAGSIRVSRSDSQFVGSGASQRLYVENVAAAFDAPREWLWDASGVSYIPASDETTASVTDAVMPVLDKLVVIQGDIAHSNLVQNVWFSGLNFAHTRYLLPASGVNNAQAGVDVGAAIEVDGAVGIVIDGCNVSHTAGYGVWFRRAVRDSRITNSSMSDLGGGGVKLGLNFTPSGEMLSGGNSAVGNQINDTGKVFLGAVGIWVGQTYDNLIANNAIFNTTYTGISVGWSWGYSAITSGRNRVLNNLLSNIGQGQLSDMSGIYTLGVSPGTVISGNVMREVRGYTGYGPGAWGIYNDEGSSNVLVENNMVVGTDSGGYHLNYGRDNVVRGNLFALGTKFEMRVTGTDPMRTNLGFDNNLLLPLVQQPFDSHATAPDVLFTNVSVSQSAFGSALNLAMCGSGCAVNTATLTTGADPRSLSLGGTDSATIARFAQIARSSGPASLISASAVAVVPSAPPVVVAAPPTAVELNIAGAAIGTQPGGLAYIPSNDMSAISVKADSGAPYGKCIAYNDSGLFEQSYYPYSYTSLNHDRGTSTAEFTLKIDANTSIGYEWRDGGNPYKSGPTFNISPAGVNFRGQTFAPAPVGTWLTFKVTAAIDNPSATWTLEVTNNTTGVKTTATNLAFASPGWNKLIWMGLMSGATTTSTACLGSFKVTSSIQ